MLSSSMAQAGTSSMPPTIPEQDPPPPPPQQPSQAQQMELKYDNVDKVKTLVWSLKDSYNHVMKVADSLGDYMDSGITAEDQPPRFDETLEDFLSLCNQVELHLKIIEECAVQQKESTSFLPQTVPHVNQETLAEGTSQSNMQYVSAVKSQANFEKASQEMLCETVRKATPTE